MDNTRTAGVALVKITKDGESKIDIQGVFRGDQSPLIGDELMRKALRQAIDIGGPDGKITLNAFAPYLPKWYESYGFVETSRADWDDQFAPKEWPFQKYMQDFPDIPDGKPQIVYMEWNPSKAGPLFRNKLGLLQETVVDEQTPLGYITQKINDNLTRIKDVDTATEKQRGAPLQDNERVYSQSRRAPNIAINKIEKVMDLLENKEGTDFLIVCGKTALLQMIYLFIYTLYIQKNILLMLRKLPVVIKNEKMLVLINVAN